VKLNAALNAVLADPATKSPCLIFPRSWIELTRTLKGGSANSIAACVSPISACMAAG
jgi:hypothetical protein